MSFQPGIAEALVYNLAARLAPDVGANLDQAVVFLAADSKATVKRLNYRPMQLESDPSLSVWSGWDQNADHYGGILMKYIIRKYVNANSAKDALKLDRKTPVHDLYLKDGEEPKEPSKTFAVGFHTIEPFEDEGEEECSK